MAAELGLPALLVSRALMGIGEGVAMPAMNNMLSRWGLVLFGNPHTIWFQQPVPINQSTSVYLTCIEGPVMG